MKVYFFGWSLHTSPIPSFNGLVEGKIYRKPPYLMVKTMVSCRFSLNPMTGILWKLEQHMEIHGPALLIIPHGKRWNANLGAARWFPVENIWKTEVPTTVVPILVGGIPTPPKKYESQLGSLFPIYGKIKNVPNHQPDKYRFVYDDLVHLENHETATVDWTFPILTYMVTKHSILPDVQLHEEGTYRRIEYDAFGNSWVPYFLWAYQYSTNPRYAMTFPDTDPNIASVLLPQIDLEWFRPIQAISNDPIYEVVWLVDSWGKHSATICNLWILMIPYKSQWKSVPSTVAPSLHPKRQLKHGETWLNHWSPKFLGRSPSHGCGSKWKT